MVDPAKETKSSQIVLILMSVVMIFGAYNAVYGKGGEYDPEFYVWFKIAVDAAVTLVAVILAVITFSAPASGLKVLSLAVGLGGIVAGAFKLYVRFGSEVGFWTGHLS